MHEVYHTLLGEIGNCLSFRYLIHDTWGMSWVWKALSRAVFSLYRQFNFCSLFAWKHLHEFLQFRIHGREHYYTIWIWLLCIRYTQSQATHFWIRLHSLKFRFRNRDIQYNPARKHKMVYKMISRKVGTKYSAVKSNGIMDNSRNAQYIPNET